MASSLNSILSVARTALQAEQMALQVAGHNLANATTEGYSRQRADLIPRTPLVGPDGVLGTGVRVADVTRARVAVLEPAVRREISLLSGASTERGILGQLEAVLGGASGVGLGPALDTLWNAWSDLSNDPASSTARVVVVSAGQGVVDELARAAASVDGAADEASRRLSSELGEVNQILGEIAELNARIASERSAAGSAPDLEDRRDLLIDRVAEYLPVVGTPREDGSIGVSVEGVSVVDGSVARTLSLSVGPGGTQVLATDSGTEIRPRLGSMGSAMTLLETDFAEVRSALDDIARALVQEVNALHEAGVGPSGTSGISFFDDLGDPSTVTARTIRLSAAVLADPQAVVAGSGDGSGVYQSGANDVALAIAGLRDTGVAGLLGGRSIGAAHRDLLGDVATRVSTAGRAEERHGLLLEAARERRESVSGVVADEELVQIIQIQAAYAAAARLIGVVDEMYQTLLGI